MGFTEGCEELETHMPPHRYTNFNTTHLDFDLNSSKLHKDVLHRKKEDNKDDIIMI